MNKVLPASDFNHGNNLMPFKEWNGNEINCISYRLELVHLVSILHNLMCLKIVEVGAVKLV